MNHASLSDVERMRLGLPEIGEYLHAQMDELYARPNAEQAEVLAANLMGAARAVLRFQEALLSGVIS